MNLKEAIAEMSYLDGLDLSSARKEAWAVIKAHFDKRPEAPKSRFYLVWAWLPDPESALFGNGRELRIIDATGKTYRAFAPGGVRVKACVTAFQDDHPGPCIVREYRNGRPVSQRTY